jgi:dTDP-glucose pyrophosphorylase
MEEEMVGLIPAAGKGVRLGLPYPKELFPIIRDNHVKPVSQCIVDCLTTAGLKHIVFVINETKHQLIGYFGNGHRFNCHISYVVQEAAASSNHSTSPGLAHALASGYHLTRGKSVYFGMADTVIQPLDVFARMRRATEPDDDVTLGLFPTQTPEKFGMVETAAGGAVRQIVDKPRETHLTEMWGCITWRPRFSEYLDEAVHRHGISDFASIMNGAIAEGMRFRGVSLAGGMYLDLGTYGEILEMDRLQRSGVAL